jgi:hypothetical protein
MNWFEIGATTFMATQAISLMIIGPKRWTRAFKASHMFYGKWAIPVFVAMMGVSSLFGPLLIPLSVVYLAGVVWIKKTGFLDSFLSE